MNISAFEFCSGPVLFFAINVKASLLVIGNETNHLDNSFGRYFQGMLLLGIYAVILKVLQDSGSTTGRRCVMLLRGESRNLTISGSTILSKRVLFSNCIVFGTKRVPQYLQCFKAPNCLPLQNLVYSNAGICFLFANRRLKNP